MLGLMVSTSVPKVVFLLFFPKKKWNRNKHASFRTKALISEVRGHIPISLWQTDGHQFFALISVPALAGCHSRKCLQVILWFHGPRLSKPSARSSTHQVWDGISQNPAVVVEETALKPGAVPGGSQAGWLLGTLAVLFARWAISCPNSNQLFLFVISLLVYFHYDKSKACPLWKL